MNVPDDFKSQGICSIKVVEKYPLLLVCVPDQHKTQELCNEAVRIKPILLEWVPDRFKTQDMCKKAVEKDPSMLKYVPDHLKVRLPGGQKKKRQNDCESNR